MDRIKFGQATIHLFFLLAIALPVEMGCADDLKKLPIGGETPPSQATSRDYLVQPPTQKATAFRSRDGKSLILDNGLIRRTWRLEPNAACVGLDNLMNGEAVLRSVRPEATVEIDGVSYEVGGLDGQPNQAFLTSEWLNELKPNPEAFQLTGFKLGKPQQRFGWARARHHAKNAEWPPRGIALRLDFSSKKLAGVRVSVNYEMYDNIPVMSKWLSIHNESDQSITLNRFTAEILAVVEEASWVENREGVQQKPPQSLHVETDFAFGGMTHRNANRHVVHWKPDPRYKTQVNYALQTPCLLNVAPTYGPEQDIRPKESFESFRVFELIHDSQDRERRGLAVRKMYRCIAPWVTENPLTHHLLKSDPESVRRAIDQAAEVGFECIIMSFGSGFNMENTDPKHLERWKRVAAYGESKGIEIGSYSLFSSRGVAKADMIVTPEGQKPTHGRCPAVTSEWGQNWLRTIQSFYDTTGFDQFENDGPYPGDVDVTPRPPRQKGERDSRWVQWRDTVAMYRAFCQKGIYINAPDYYYLNGAAKCGMGYREVNWSLPRAQQVIHTRQNIYDGTWEKTPTMGWMHVPLAQYHGGGAAATIEPLHQHRDHYRRMLQSNLGLGVQAHYRGPRLYDTPETREMVRSVIDWFKTYRDILESDVIHGRRADGRDIDWMLHVNPELEIPGMLCVYNPLDHQVTRRIAVDVYYTGLTELAMVAHQDQNPKPIKLNRDHTISIEVTIPASGMTWLTLRRP